MAGAPDAVHGPTAGDAVPRRPDRRSAGGAAAAPAQPGGAGTRPHAGASRRGWWIDIPGEETKTHQPIEAPWPEALAPALEVYLRQHRPMLCGLRNRWTRPVGNALWVSTHGSPMTMIAIYDVFTRRTAAAFGQSINPHLFRDCAATSIAIDDPAARPHRLADPRAPVGGRRPSATTIRRRRSMQRGAIRTSLSGCGTAR